MFKRNIERLERKIAFYTELANGWFTQDQIATLKAHHMTAINRNHWIRRSFITHTLTVAGQEHLGMLQERLERLKTEYEESKKRIDDPKSHLINDNEVSKFVEGLDAE